MIIFAIYDKNDKFVAGFPTKNDAQNYGKKVFGLENGWEYSIKEKSLINPIIIPQIPLPTPPITTPYTPPIPLKTTPYGPNIWCGNDGPTATYEEVK